MGTKKKHRHSPKCQFKYDPLTGMYYHSFWPYQVDKDFFKLPIKKQKELMWGWFK